MMGLIRFQKISIQFIISNIFILRFNKMNKNNIYQELIQNQRKNLNQDKKLSLSDLKRVSTYLNKTIFSEECSLWQGYVTEIKKSSYFVNFFFKGKKQALHRLLYYNFVNDITDSEYLKFTCENKGKCCSLKHFLLVKDKNQDNDKNKKENLEISIENKSKKDITVIF